MQIIWYPLFGQLYVLANHLRIDRSNPTAAIESMKEVTLFPPHCLSCIFFPVYLTCNPYHAQAARAVVKNNLSLIIFPEGTRSKNGRLLPFKKALIHPLFDHIISSHLLYNSHSGIGGNIVHGIKWQKSRRGIQANVLSTGLGPFLEY